MSQLPDIPSAKAERNRAGSLETVLRIIVPLAILGAALLLWHLLVQWNNVPSYILPGPTAVWQSLVEDWGILWPSLLATLRLTLAALLLAVAGGVLLAVLLVQSRWIELGVLPFAVILQVTPVVAIAPLLLIYVPNLQGALLVCAFLVAFFPILANSMAGLKSADRNLVELFELHGARRWQMLLWLQLPGALPYFLAGLRIAGGLALIGAVVAEFVAGSAGAGSGLAYRVLEAQYRLNMPRLFAALVLLTAAGVAIYALTALLSWLLLRRWHESALRREPWR